MKKNLNLYKGMRPAAVMLLCTCIAFSAVMPYVLSLIHISWLSGADGGRGHPGGRDPDHLAAPWKEAAEYDADVRRRKGSDLSLIHI